MACMCGDYCCWSCGPAQGNHKCPICNEWASEGCDHINPRTGKLYGRFRAEARRLREAEAKAEDAMMRDFEEVDSLIAAEVAEHGPTGCTANDQPRRVD